MGYCAVAACAGDVGAASDGGSEVPKHEDQFEIARNRLAGRVASGLGPQTNDDVLAVGVMLDDCTVENGAMMVMRGTHLGPPTTMPMAILRGDQPTNCDLDFAGAVPVVGNAGTVSFHNARLVHGSAQNLSMAPRNFLLYEFTGAQCYPLLGVADLAEFDSRLISGEPTIEPDWRSSPFDCRCRRRRVQGRSKNQSMAKDRYFQNRSAGFVR